VAQITLQNYYDVAFWTYYSGLHAGVPDPDFRTFAVNANHYDSKNDYDSLNNASGFYGAAYVTGMGADRTVVIGFEGTNPYVFDTQTEFATAQIFADVNLYYGRLPAALTDALAFTRSVIATAAEQGISTENIVLAGHSLGAAEAQFVAAATGLKGVTFGTVGVSTQYTGGGGGSGLLNYVEHGDPVGNYAYTFPLTVEAGFLYSDEIQHYGSTTYLGSLLDAAPLIAASAAFATGNEAAQAAAFTTFAAAAAEFHLLPKYAESLGLHTADADWMTNFTAEDYLDILEQVLGDDFPTPQVTPNATLVNTASSPAWLLPDGTPMATSGAAATIDEVKSAFSTRLGPDADNLVLTGKDAVDAWDNGADNVIFGNSGDNLIFLSGGDDVVDGGAGDDRLVLSGPRSQYAIQIADGLALIHDQVTGDTIKAAGIQSITFGGHASGYHMALFATDQTAITGLYEALLQRAPDESGFAFYVERSSEGWRLDAIADSILHSAEYANLRAGQSTDEMVDAFYHHVLARAPDESGEAYWKAEIAGGRAVGLVGVNFVVSPEFENHVDIFVDRNDWLNVA
jgi:hypothetical protein